MTENVARPISRETAMTLFEFYPIFDRTHERFATGFNCEEGWVALIARAARKFTQMEFTGLRIIGIKEKIGKLVVEVRHTDMRNESLIREIQDHYWRLSRMYCERCGARKGPNQDCCKPMNSLRAMGRGSL